MNNIGPTVRTIGTIVSILAAVGAGAKYIGQSIYTFAKGQTLMIEHIDQLREGLVQEHKDAQSAASAAMTAARSASDLIPPIQSDIVELKRLAQKNLDVSNSHTQSIEDTRKALKGSEPR